MKGDAMATTTELCPSGTTHILLDDRGRGWIDDTRVRVDQIVADVIGPEKMSPERIIEEYPDAGLTLAQIHAAQAWYYDHKTEIDAHSARELARVEVERAKQQNSPLRQRARSLKAAREAANGQAPS
jgi:uncharacterized protein (DUF433 family)